MLNILIPLAGAGSRFQVQGYDLPKPLIDVKGKPMIQVVIGNLTPSLIAHRFIFVCQKIHASKFSLPARLLEWAPGSEVVLVDGLTDGAARTVMAAKHLIDVADPLIIANSDQYVPAGIDGFADTLISGDSDGVIMTMTASDPKWSYVEFDRQRMRIVNVVEKEVVSNEATVGIYGFQRGSDFVSAAAQMFSADFRVNGEFYVAPVYNWLIARGGFVKAVNIGTVEDGMYGLGTPVDLEKFLKVGACLD